MSDRLIYVELNRNACWNYDWIITGFKSKHIEGVTSYGVNGFRDVYQLAIL